jgi:adenine-specific DNA-methyltransferase
MTKKANGKEYENWSKEELIKEIVKIKSTTYGLVWHRDVPEEKIDILINPDARTPNEMFPNEMAGKPFPVLKEVKGKAIESDKSKLVNFLIEGDNYHSLAVLNFTHREAVDLIYIDPPYNTGNGDFIYNDKFIEKEDSFRHSKWLSFMEKRLKLAKNLLTPSGAIFISIDDHEQAPLKMLCDEIFGETNFIAQIIWQKKYAASNDNKTISNIHEYVLCYSKTENQWKPNLFKRPEELDAKYKNPDNDPRGAWYSTNLSVKTFSEKNYYEIISPAGKKFLPPPSRCWVVSKEKYKELLNDNRIWFGKEGNSRPYQKTFLSEVQQGIVPDTLWLHKDAGHNIEAKSILRAIFDGQQDLFDTPKPVRLIKRIVELSTNKNSTVLDFFAGSGTTAHAVLELNKEDGGHRNFILCTNNGDEKSEHKIASDICYPRVKKVINGYKIANGEKVEGLGGNLKYYTTDFVEAEPTDKNKRKLVKESTDMLCIMENAFELVQEAPEFKIFKNTNEYLGVIFYEEAIEDYKKAIKKIDGHFNTYVFSMGDDPHTKKFADVKSKVTLCAIPEVILKVYREIFK